jgi:hypothetical protein
MLSKWLDKHNIEKYILVQFSWWSISINLYMVSINNINPNRNYQPFLAQQVINLLKEEYKDAQPSLIVPLPNEPAYFNSIKCDLHWTDQYMSY